MAKPMKKPTILREMIDIRRLLNVNLNLTDPPRNPPTGLFGAGSVPTDGADDAAAFRRTRAVEMERPDRAGRVVNERRIMSWDIAHDGGG